MTHRIASLGASGYTGAELVRLIATHPSMKIVALSADRKAGMSMDQVFPFLRHLDLPTLVKIDEIDFSGIDLCFCALPHATSQAVISQLPRNLKIVDLSADFRLRDPAEYEKWYGNTLLLVGCEINDKENRNHYLAFGIDEAFSTRTPAKKYVTKVK